MILAEKLRMFLPRAAKVTQAKSVFRKALTPLMILHGVSPVGQQPNRTLTTKTITKSLELVTNSTKELKFSPGNQFQVLKAGKTSDELKPLTILLCWLMSQKKHVIKYAQFYLDQGFDVLTVSVTPWQLLWPVSGTQVIAKDILSFVTNNEQYNQTMLHGFSVGGYLWGEVLTLMAQDLDKYQPFMDRIVGQIWDSVVDFEGIPTGLPKAVFPKNTILRSSLETYVRYHMARFHQTATQHYLLSSQHYHNNLIRSPALFLCSLDDPVGTVAGIQKVIDRWEENGVNVKLKAWGSSPHVSHLHHHPEEYKEEMKLFLEKLGLAPYPEKFAHKVKSRSV